DWEAQSIIPRRRGTGAAPLSFAQQRLWFLQQLEPENCSYNEVRVLEIEGSLDTDALMRAIREVIRRHEVLRSTFQDTSAGPHQIIHALDAFPLEVPVVDLTHLPDVDRRRRLMSRAQEEARRPFELASGPLVRLVLMKVSGDRWGLIHAMHHIVV